MIHLVQRNQQEDLCRGRRQRRATILVAKGVVLGILCSFPPSFSKAETGAERLRLGYFPNITHAQALYARATGEFEKATGIRIDWVSFNAEPSAVEAMFVNAVDATFIGPSPTINGYIKSKGEKFVIVAG